MNLRQVHTATKMQTGFPAGIGVCPCIDRLSQFLTRSEDN
nr:hypothetical protein [uncultured Mediterranean phage uvMED]